MPAKLITNATTNITSMKTLFDYIQTDVSTLFFPLILFGIYIITFIILRGNSDTNSKAFAGTCFFGMILSVLLRTLGWLSNGYMYLSITLVGLSAIWIHLENR